MDPKILKPFLKKTFFLDLKYFPNQAKLAADLELLGAKEVPLCKSVSFVVSDRIPVKENQTGCPNTSSLKCTSFDFFNNSAINSPVGSPAADARPQVMTRNMVILQKAMKKQDGTSNVMEICKKWNIKIFPVQKVLSWVKKYKSLNSKYYVAEQKKSAKALVNTNESVQKLNGPFVKIEDEKKKYKARYRVFTSWKDIVDPSLSRSVIRLRENLRIFGNINDSVRPPLREVNRNLLHSSLHVLNSRSVSLTKISGISVSNLISACPANDGAKEDFFCYPSKRKTKELTTKSKKRYCEVCATHFNDLETHLNSQQHQNFINKEKYFDDVQSVISSLPQASDFISSLIKVENEENREKEQNLTTEVGIHS